MRNQFDIITVPTSDTSAQPTIIVTFDDKRYLFNCGEGAQRQMVASKVPMRKIKEIFTTYGWESHGGLAGVLLSSSSDSGNLDIGVHGPQNLAYYLATLRAGQQRGMNYAEKIDFRIHEYKTPLPEPFTDHNLTIQPVLTLPGKLPKVEQGQEPVSESEPKGPRTRYAGRADLQDPVRILNVARSVWSGQFLEQQNDGMWASRAAGQQASVTDSILDPQSQQTSLGTKRGRSPSPPNSLGAKKCRPFPAEGHQDQVENYRPDSEKLWAFNEYMGSDLPLGTKPFPAAVSYVIQAKARPGRFDPVKAKALGILPGPNFGKLQKGTAVRLPGGSVVHPQDVMGPPRTSPAVLIVDCPSVDYITNLRQNEFWSTCKDERRLALIVHSCGNNVLENPDYIEFMASFGSSVQHLISRADYQTDKITNAKCAQYLSRLRQLDPEIYPRLFSVDHPQNSDFEAFEKEAVDASAIEKGLQFVPGPYLSIIRTGDIKPDVHSVELAQLLQEYTQDCKQVSLDIEKLANEHNVQFRGSDVEIITLGTGSAGPSNYRNVASTMVSAPGGLSFLLDCGEGTVGQMKRAFGETYVEVLQTLRFVFISHMHADHHLGLIGLIKEWTMHNSQASGNLFIMCPNKYTRSIQEYENIEAIGLSRISFLDSLIHQDDSGEQQNSYRKLIEAIPEFEKVRTVAAIHSERAVSASIRIDHRDGWSVAYSGDTRPNFAFARLGRGVTCLIHEATFENDMLDEAVKKRHSTLGEALQISRDMKARTTILTHFSQRYAKIPRSKDLRGIDLAGNCVGLANDFMRVRLQDVWKLGHYIQPQIALERKLEKMQLNEEDSNSEHIVLDES